MKTIYEKDPINKKMNVTREFSAPVAQVWRAWTEPELLDQWWAPKPWKTETKSMNFKEGGTWLYAMVGPDGTRHYARADFKKIIPQKSFDCRDSFVDEKGNFLSQLPEADWTVEFLPTAAGTKVQVVITYASEKDMMAFVEMGFEEGFRAAHDNLDELLAKEVQHVK